MPILVRAQIKLAYIYTSYQWDVKGGLPKRQNQILEIIGGGDGARTHTQQF